MRDWLVDIRRKRNESQQEIANTVGIAQSTYASLETGARSPSVDMAKRIASALGFDWTRFFERDAKGA